MHVEKVLALFSAERSAGAGEEDLVDAAVVLIPKALVDRGVLAVDRDDRDALVCCGLGDQVPCRDKGLLIRKGDRLARTDRSQRRLDADHADHRVDKDVGGSKDCLHDHAVHAGEDLCVGVCDPHREVLCRGLVIQAGKLRVELPDLLFHLFDVLPGGQRNDPEVVRIGPHDVEGLGADGAGGAYYNKILFHFRPRNSEISVTKGRRLTG